jgi:hypothetical protein
MEELKMNVTGMNDLEVKAKMQADQIRDLFFEMLQTNDINLVSYRQNVAFIATRLNCPFEFVTKVLLRELKDLDVKIMLLNQGLRNYQNEMSVYGK